MKISKFQIVVLGIFVLAIIAGVAAFALYRGSQTSTTLPSITIWGTYPASTMNDYVNAINNTNTVAISVSYVQQDSASFGQNFINALARGQGPDVILVPADMILPHEDKIYQIPYSILTQRTYMDTYIDEADVYMTGTGLMAIPFALDPLIMYWNRDLFNGAGLASYPKYWDDFKSLNQKLTDKDQNGNVRRSAIALGEFSNITHARELLGTLFMQAGNRITSSDGQGNVSSSLDAYTTASVIPAVSFYTQAVDPSGQEYSWNKSMPNDKTAFLSGVLATYFGYASEIGDIRSKNPNLNFDAAPLPQIKNGTVKAAYAKMYGFSLLKSSANLNAAYQVVSILTGSAYMPTLTRSTYLPPVRKDMIAQGSSDAYMTIFEQAALISRTWLDADPQISGRIMSDMIGAVTSGQADVRQAVADGSSRYDVALKSAVK